MTNQKYILKGKKIIPVDLLIWAKYFETENRHIGNDSIGRTRVSTVFLGIDYNFSPKGKPLLFETMIFGGKHDQYQERYSTYKEAKEGHKRALKLVKESVLS